MSKLLDDPRLTAYALEELSQQQREEFEMEMKNETQEVQDQLNMEIEVIQEQASSLKLDLTTDEMMRLTPEQVDKIAKETYEKEKTRKWITRLVQGMAVTFPLILVALNVLSPKKHLVHYLEPKSQQLSNVTEGLFSQADSLAPQMEREQIAVSSRSKAELPKGVQRKSLTKKKVVMGYASDEMGLGGPAGKIARGNFAPRTAPALSDSLPEPFIPPQWQKAESNTESYEGSKPNDFVSVRKEPLSTFSVDVDTASYANARRFLNNGSLPPADSIRVEEFINYFDYGYAAPLKDSKDPFATHLEMAQSPYNSKYNLVKIGIKAKEMRATEAPLSNIVFLLDVSGSMSAHNKLPLVREAMKLLTRKLTEKDKISIVVYAGASGLVLPPTAGNDKATIMAALTKLKAGGSTNGGAGIELAYKTAQENFIKEGNNRVILVTDGDFNVGTTSRDNLVSLIEDKAKSNIFLTILGVGMGNYKDSTLEKLADKGNGNYAYLDTLNEAKKVLVRDRFKTLHTVAKDVKIQVEFNPTKVQAYRLIGYENRKLNKEDFNDDTKDAGEIGAGHTVTALYEIVPHGVEMPKPSVDNLRYQKLENKDELPVVDSTEGKSDEVLFVKIRYKEPAESKSKKLEFTLKDSDKTFAQASDDFKFASAVAGFGMALRKDNHVGEMSIQKIIDTAKASKGNDEYGSRIEFIENVELARELYHK